MGLVEDHFRKHGWPKSKEEAIAAKAVYDKARIDEQEQRELDAAGKELRVLKYIDRTQDTREKLRSLRALMCRAAVAEWHEGGSGI